MDNRKKELDWRYAEAFLSKYKREDNQNKEAIIISLSRIVEIMEECEPSMKVEPHEVLTLMVIHKFEHTRKDAEFWYFVKET